MEQPEDSPEKSIRLNITVKPETKARLDEARNKRQIEINVSQVCDGAINLELDRRERPGIADVVARLRVEADKRRGVPYRTGFLEGQRWAREVASWQEICNYAALEEGDVAIKDIQWTGNGGPWWVVGFSGQFRAPTDDYLFNAPSQWGAPAYPEHGWPVDEQDEWVTDRPKCDQYWRGWLSAVRELFEQVRDELDPLQPQPIAAAPGPPEPAPTRDVDPDDIPF